MAALAMAPASRARDVALEAGRTTQGHLAQALGPLPPAIVAQIGERAAALVSEDPAARSAAERERADVRREDAAASTRLAAVSAELGAEREKNKAIAADNAALAAAYLKMKIAAWSAAGLSALLGVAAFAYRANAFGIAGKLAESLVGLERKHGTATADTARTFLDMALDAGDKSKVFAALSKIAPDIAGRVSASP
jgi:hypothetical protein